MALADLIDKVHRDQELSALIDMHVAKEDRNDTSRAPGWHPSEFCGSCARRHVLARLVGQRSEAFEPSLLKIFAMGHAIHYWYQNKYFGPMGILWGKWQCLRCDAIHWGLMPTDPECFRCKQSSRWDYREVPVRASLPDGFEAPIVGHSDGIIFLNRKWWLLEIKSINDGGFTWQKQAKESHVAQARIYGELIQQGHVDFACDNEYVTYRKPNIPRLSGIVLLYVNKNNSRERIYNIDLDPEASRRELKRPYLIETAFRDKELPKREEACVSLNKKPAKNCPVVSYCFGGLSWDQLTR